MCIDIQITDGRSVPCRNCWQCNENRVNSLVGRCVAEQQFSNVAYAVTLTYRDGEAGASELLYGDFQLFMKRLKRKFDVRFIVGGEYGTEKGRAHWHAVLFFKDKGPDLVPAPKDNSWEIALDRNIHWKPWPRGFVFFQKPNADSTAALRYPMKYSIPDSKQQSNKTMLQMSKKPLLGYDFICEYAQRFVDARLVPNDFNYTFDHLWRAESGRETFYFLGRSQSVFLGQFLHRWIETYGPDVPSSPLIESEFDKYFARYLSENGDHDDTYQRQKGFPFPPVNAPPYVEGEGLARIGEFAGVSDVKWIQWKSKAVSVWDDERNVYWHVEPAHGPALVREARGTQGHIVEAQPQREFLQELRQSVWKDWLQEAVELR